MGVIEATTVCVQLLSGVVYLVCSNRATMEPKRERCAVCVVTEQHDCLFRARP